MMIQNMKGIMTVIVIQVQIAIQAIILKQKVNKIKVIIIIKRIIKMKQLLASIYQQVYVDVKMKICMFPFPSIKEHKKEFLLFL